MSVDRISELQKEMKAKGLDLLVVGQTANMRYLIDYVPHPDERLCMLLITKNDRRFVVPALNAEETSANTDVDLYQWADADGPLYALRDALAGVPEGCAVAFDGGMRADFIVPLLNAVSPKSTSSLDEIIKPMRSKKSANELVALRASAAQADKAMQAAVDACVPGATENQVAWAAEEAFRLDGAERVEFTLIASGPNGSRPHHHTGERVLKTGDVIILDIGASLNGYKSDISRVVALGEPSAEIRKAFDAVLQANVNGRAAVKPGVTAESIDQAARGTCVEAGYGEFFIHRTGHGLGLDIHEAPWMMEGNKEILEEGMVFSVEPGVYLPDQFGIRVEDIVAVTSVGCETLTQFPHEMVVKK